MRSEGREGTEEWGVKSSDRKPGQTEVEGGMRVLCKGGRTWRKQLRGQETTRFLHPACLKPFHLWASVSPKPVKEGGVRDH